jgi:hypothetical protein
MERCRTQSGAARGRKLRDLAPARCQPYGDVGLTVVAGASYRV